MKHLRFPLFLFAIFFIACQGNQGEETLSFKPGSVKELQEVNKDGDYRYRGDLVKAVSWQDAGGQNTFVDNRCDVSPVEMGMALWSGDQQLLLRGLVPPPEDDQWTEPLPDPDVDPASTLTDMSLRTKARALWEEF